MKPYEEEMMLDLERMKWDGAGLIPAVVQDVKGEVLMVAYMNRQALAETIETGYGTYYSRSRQTMWRKGESSGNRQRVLEMRVDCDLDCVVMKVEQTGGACHTGYYSCFYRKIEDGKIVITEKPVFDAEKAYSKA
ncbi:MAG TPA: phosphoribosyl-AMP cyclohydrolase [Armatimonadota bacterium]|nr:phosphoribosyl-AMP cyclohydrolase [Armatimonadota bacterium]